MEAEAIALDWGWPQMEEVLQCPICFELPTGQILMCSQGHHLCTPCRKKVQSCPLCKSIYTSRNLAVEELLANISVIKNLMTLANIKCMIPCKPDSLKESKSVNQFINKTNPTPPPPQSRGQFPCVICLSSFPVSRMLIHLRYLHLDDLIEVPSENQRAEFNVQFKYEKVEYLQLMHRAVKIDKLGVFFISMSFMNESAYVFLRMVAANNDAKDYSYTLRTGNFNYQSRAKSCGTPKGYVALYNYRKCLVVESVDQTCRRNKSLVVNVTIHRNISEIC